MYYNRQHFITDLRSDSYIIIYKNQDHPLFSIQNIHLESKTSPHAEIFKFILLFNLIYLYHLTKS
jgi:hypothetical protein